MTQRTQVLHSALCMGRSGLPCAVGLTLTPGLLIQTSIPGGLGQ